MSADVTVSTAAAEAPSLVWLDPATLMSHPANVRDELGDVSDLAASIAMAGVIEPLVVIPLDDGGVRILAGHRRAAAAVVAGLEAVPCLVRPDLTGADDEQLAAALAENIQRQGLSPQEEAHAYAQLSAFPGWSTGRIAQATGRDELAVRRSIEASTLAPELQPAAIATRRCGSGGELRRRSRHIRHPAAAHQQPGPTSRPGAGGARARGRSACRRGPRTPGGRRRCASSSAPATVTSP